MSQKLTLYLLGKRYDVSLKGMHERTHAELAWLSEVDNLDLKVLLKAYLEKCQECAEIQERLESLCEKLERP